METTSAASMPPDVEALLSTVRSGSAAKAAKSGPAAFASYNFSRAGQISTEQMRAISTVNDLFARNLTHTMGAWLRSEFQVLLKSGEQMPYAEFVMRVEENAYTCSVRLEPMGSLGVLEVSLQLAAPIVDLLLGGMGKAAPERPLTDIEELIMASVMGIIARELNTAWAPVGLQFAFEKRETTAQVARMMPGGERSLRVHFEVKMPEAQGTISLSVPAVVLNTILRKLVTDRDKPRRRSDEVRTRVGELVGEATVGSVLQFPPVRLSARELSSLEPGTVLRLPVPRHAVAELRVGGLAFGRARPVRTGEHRGARMEAAEAQPAGESQRSEELR